MNQGVKNRGRFGGGSIIYWADVCDDKGIYAGRLALPFVIRPDMLQVVMNIGEHKVAFAVLRRRTFRGGDKLIERPAIMFPETHQRLFEALVKAGRIELGEPGWDPIAVDNPVFRPYRPRTVKLAKIVQQPKPGEIQ